MWYQRQKQVLLGDSPRNHAWKIQQRIIHLGPDLQTGNGFFESDCSRLSAAKFRFRGSTGTLTTHVLTGGFGDFEDGHRGRIRYETPSFGGFKVSAAYGEEKLTPTVTPKFRDIARVVSKDWYPRVILRCSLAHLTAMRPRFS